MTARQRAAHANELFARVKCWRAHKGERHAIGDERTDNWPAARSFDDYALTVERDGLPEGIEVIER
jgi:CRISPR-associated protein Csd2